MSPSKRFGWIAACALTALAAESQSLVAPYNPTNRPSVFKAQVEAGEVLGDTTIHHAFLSCGTNRFSFVLPEGYRVDCSQPDKSVVLNDQYDCLISLRVLGPMPPDSTATLTDYSRDLLFHSYPHSQITEESEKMVMNHLGPAFDFQWRDSGSTPQKGRAIFLKTPAGVIELTLTSPAQKFLREEQVFNALLLTFRSNEGGKLEVVHYSSNI